MNLNNHNPIRSFQFLQDAVLYYSKTTPHKVAIDDENGSISYEKLANAMDCLANRLLQLGVRPQQKIALYLDNGILGVVAILGILRCGACYVPLDFNSPKSRTNRILQLCDIRFIITDSNLIDRCSGNLTPGLGSILCLSMTRDHRTNYFYPFDGTEVIIPSALCENESLAYIIYTSGTSGSPKGVMISHRNVVNLLIWGLERFNPNYDDRFANHSKLFFDASVWDIFMSLFVGATLFPITQLGDRLSPGDFIRRNKITMWLSVPFIIGLMDQYGDLGSQVAGNHHLRVALFGGEALSVSLALKFTSAFPRATLYHCYGPTETTVMVTCFEVPLAPELTSLISIPIGEPVSNIDLLICDEDYNVLPIGSIGTLLIGGSQLSAGYFPYEEAELRRFVTISLKTYYDSGDLVFRDSQGQLHFRGRKDTQVKIYGQRIELREIENVLCNFKNVQDAAVFLNLENPHKLVAYVSLFEKTNRDDLQKLKINLLNFTKAFLPMHMIPSSVIFMATLPHTVNNKIDRMELKLHARYHQAIDS